LSFEQFLNIKLIFIIITETFSFEKEIFQLLLRQFTIMIRLVALAFEEVLAALSHAITWFA